MFLSKERRAIFIAFLAILAVGCFMILPLLAQPGDPPPEEGSGTEIMETEDATAADEESAVEEPAEEPESATSEVTEGAVLEPELLPPTMGTVNVEKPSEFKVRDFPSDEGGVFLISWPKTGLEMNDPDSTTGYKYRIYHTMDPSQVVNGQIQHLEKDEGAGTPASYTDFEPLSDDLETVRNHFWPNRTDKNFHAFSHDTPRLPVLDKDGEPRINPEGNPMERPDFKNEWFFQLAMVDDSNTMEYITPVDSAVSISNSVNLLRINNFLLSIIYCLIVLVFINQAKRGRELFIRKIAGLDAVDEAIGRATEMGKPILYLTGLDALSNVSTIAAINILGQVAKKVADYDSKIINPNRDPIVMSVCQEVVKEAYMDAGRPDAYNPDSIFFVTDDQFSFTAAVDGIMVREKPATNIFMGYYYAESLILAETGASTGAIQIAGTDSIAQLPFFITTCDYTLIGEELYAASAYLAREPLLLGSLKGQDVGKMFLMVMLVLGVLLVSISTNLNFISAIFAAE